MNGNNENARSPSIIVGAFFGTLKFILVWIGILAFDFMLEKIAQATGLAEDLNLELTIISSKDEIIQLVNESGGAATRLKIMLISVPIIVFVINLIRHYKRKKRFELEEKADAVLDYAQSAGEYHKNEALVEDYGVYLEGIGQKNQKEADSIGCEYRTLKEDVAGCDNDIIKEYLEEQEIRAEKQKHVPNNIFSVKKIILIAAALFLLLPVINSIFSGNFSEGVNEKALEFQGEIGICILTSVIYFTYTALKKRSDSISDGSVIYIKLLPHEIEKAFGGQSIFECSSGLPDEEIYRMNCFTYKPSSISGKNLICGRYKNVDFCFSCEEIISEYRDDEGELEKRNEFSGFMVSIPYPKCSESSLGLHSNSREEIINSVEVQNKRRKVISSEISGTENVDFNKLFTISSDDEKNLYYILTPHTMEKISTLYRHFCTGRRNISFEKSDFSNGTEALKNLAHIYGNILTPQKMYIFFYKSRMYMGINSGRQLFHYKETSGGAENIRSLILADIDTVKQLLDFALTLY